LLFENLIEKIENLKSKVLRKKRKMEDKMTKNKPKEGKVICPDCKGSGDEADYRIYRQGGDQFPVPECNKCSGTGLIEATKEKHGE
jgi:DnaJ-class molecular chaperone